MGYYLVATAGKSSHWDGLQNEFDDGHSFCTYPDASTRVPTDEESPHAARAVAREAVSPAGPSVHATPFPSALYRRPSGYVAISATFNTPTIQIRDVADSTLDEVITYIKDEEWTSGLEAYDKVMHERWRFVRSTHLDIDHAKSSTLRQC